METNNKITSMKKHSGNSNIIEDMCSRTNK